MNNLDDLQDQLDHNKSVSDFRRSIRSLVRRMWDGGMLFDFIDGMNFVLQRHLAEAWLKGAKQCGISENELTDQEISERERFINSQFPHVANFGSDIEENSKADGGLLRTHFFRAELWVKRYEEAVNLGKAKACKDKKLIWVLGEAEHCRSCLKLEGKVKRASYWNERGIIPRVAGARYLECRGYNCQCSLQETDKPISKGPLPGLP